MKQNIKFGGIENTRDLGGIKNSEGKTIKSSLILRGGHLQNATKEDVLILKEKYNLKHVIDLRSEQERLKHPDLKIEGVEYHIMPFFEEDSMGITGGMGADVLSAVKNAKDKEELLEYIPDLRVVYPLTVTNDYSISQISKVMKLIMNNRDGSVLFHCTAGKDRTGITAALILSILGVETDEIYDDYLTTNCVTKKKAVVYGILAKLFFNKEISQKAYDVFMANEEYLEMTFKTIDENYGSLDKYVREKLKISDDEIAEFREYILN